MSSLPMLTSESPDGEIYTHVTSRSWNTSQLIITMSCARHTATNGSCAPLGSYCPLATIFVLYALVTPGSYHATQVTRRE